MVMNETTRYYVLKVGDAFIVDLKLEPKDSTVRDVVFGSRADAMLWHPMLLDRYVLNALNTYDEQVEVLDATASVFGQEEQQGKVFLLKKGEAFVTDLTLVNAGMIVRGVRFGERLDAMRFLRDEILKSSFMESLLEQEPSIKVVKAPEQASEQVTG